MNDFLEGMSQEDLSEYQDVIGYLMRQQNYKEHLNYHPDIEYEIEIPKGYFTLEELKAKKIWKPIYADLIGNKCDCGSDLISNYDMSVDGGKLTVIRCSNLRCPHVLASSLLKIAKEYKIKGIGPATAYSVITSNGYTSILDFFERPPKEYEDDVAFIKSKAKDFASCVKLLAIPTVAEQASVIFDKTMCFADYVKQIQDSGSLYHFLLSKVGGSGKQASNLESILAAYNYEIKNIEKVFKITAKAKYDYYLAMTGSVTACLKVFKTNKLTKQQYINFLNELYPGMVTFKMTGSVSKANIVIADYTSTSSKYVEGTRQEKIVSSMDFLAYVTNREVFLKDVQEDN